METIATHTLTTPVPLTGSSSSFLPVKWIIALAGIGSIVLFVALYVFLFGPADKTVLPVYSFDEATMPVKQRTLSPIDQTTLNQVKESKISLKSLKKIKTEQEIVLELVPVQPNSNPYVSIFNGETKTTEDTAYVFPILTDEEIKANQRQKKKMAEQLARFSKEKYVAIPMGSFIYGKDTFSCRSFYIQTTEVTNLEYRTFLFDLLIDGKKKEFLLAKPDQDQWIKKFSKDANLGPMKEKYFSHPAYNDYPVVNISKEGAEMYCNWLSVAANQKLKEKSKPLINDLRIPTDYEWAYAASNKKNKSRYANGWENLRDRRGLYIQNYNCADYTDCWHDTIYDLYRYKGSKEKEIRPMDDGGFLTTAKASYAPNAYGLYDMAGNVSEMVYLWNGTRNNAQAFGTKGGSWMSPDYFLEIDAKQEFTYPEKPSPFIGFRPVITAVVK